MSRVEHAGGASDTDVKRVDESELRDRDGRWFKTFPAHWPTPPIGEGPEAREEWIAVNTRRDSLGKPRWVQPPPVPMPAYRPLPRSLPAGAGLSPQQARAVLARAKQRGDEQGRAALEAPSAALARVLRRDPRLALIQLYSRGPCP